MANEPMSPLVSTSWLAEQMGANDLRIFDTTVHIRPAPEGGVEIVTASDIWNEGHIPGSGRLDLVTEISDPAAKLWFTPPAPDDLAAAFAAAGIGEGTRVVLYDSRFNMWATRAWWLLRSIGFDNAAVLDGGLKSWAAEGNPVSTDAAPVHPAGNLVAKPRPRIFTDSDGVQAAVDGHSSCIINSLSPENHDGSDAGYGKPGHIPGAANVPAAGLVDPETQRYRHLDELRVEFEGAGAGSGPIITYCGGGIAATSDAFILHLLGHEDVTVYDGSLRDWIDKDLPLEV
jgi:thiosulfate/3-mercaptopyruvate sulfurtransferase